MRIDATLDALFPAIRAGVLSATLLQPERWWFMTELARQLGVTPSSLQRELEALVGSRILLRRQDGRRIYYKANTESPVFPEMKGLIEKTAGMVPTLKAELKRFDDRIELALVYGSVARGEEKSGSDVDLMIVGSLKQIDLLPALRKLESRFRREVNVTLFSSEEFQRKLAAGDHFLKAVLKGKTIPLKGALDELKETASRE
ncbi:MAG TPA: nucleotidyltransferase domain-containing protein [Terracidiphilus sp.]|jgi:predicted nucleotidyltransferase